VNHRPCGACGQLVTAAGCMHWNPRSSMVIIDPATATVRQRNTAAKRRSREIEREAKANASEAVRKFYDSMGWRGLNP
jgi:hypothetical protein